MDELGLSVNRKESKSQTNYSRIFVLLFSLTLISVVMIIGLYTYRNYSLSELVSIEEEVAEDELQSLETEPSITSQLAEVAITPSPEVTSSIDLDNIEVTLNPDYEWKELTGTEAANLKETALAWYTDEKQIKSAPVRGSVWRAEFDTTQVNLISMWPFIQSEESLMEIGWNKEMYIQSNRLIPNLADSPLGSASGMLIGSGSEFKIIFWSYLQTQTDAYYDVMISETMNFEALQSLAREW